jgi:hypothetical protein
VKELDAVAVVEGVVAEMGVPAPWTDGICALAGIPAIDITSTAMSTRAAALGLATGRGFAHHELRVRLPMPDGLEPEVVVWEGGTVPEWRSGVLAEPKYFSFFQDAPLPVYNPNYRGKWRPHELLHGAVGFYWAPEMTRFAFYVGARVSEILPVVHWYAFDEMFRPRCAQHRHKGALRSHCQACEDARTPFWQAAVTPAEEHIAVEALRAGVAHLDDELWACREELRLGQIVARPRPGLDSASDAQGYLRSHWNRCTAWSFGSWVELFLQDGEDYVSSPAELVDGVESVAEALMRPAAAVDEGLFRRRLERRALQDLGYRVLLELERRPETDPAEAALWPLLERAGAACGSALDGDVALGPARDALVTAAVELGMVDVGSQGLPGRRRTAGEVAQVRAGLVSSFQMAPGAAADFADTAAFWGAGRMSVRYVASGLDDGPLEAASQRRLEAWLTSEPRKDAEAELFAAVPESVEELAAGRLRRSETLRRGTFPGSVLGDTAAEVHLAATLWDGEARVIAVTPPQAVVLDWMEAGGTGPCPEDTALLELLQVGALVWIPPVGSPL